MWIFVQFSSSISLLSVELINKCYIDVEFHSIVSFKKERCFESPVLSSNDAIRMSWYLCWFILSKQGAEIKRHYSSYLPLSRDDTIKIFLCKFYIKAQLDKGSEFQPLYFKHGIFSRHASNLYEICIKRYALNKGESKILNLGSFKWVALSTLVSLSVRIC